MSDEQIGFLESVSLAVGGMVGGGIFAVLGVVAAAAGTAAWIAFVGSGVLAACAGYSFVRLIRESEHGGGPVDHVEEFTGERWLAGMAGWLFTFGYVGTMAMYALAFGEYAVALLGARELLGVAARPIVSVGCVALFVGLNTLGARASGRAEDALVAAKVGILVVFAGAGLHYGADQGLLRSGFSALGGGVVTAAAISFVAFEGWELLAFDLGSVRDAETTVPRAIYAAIAGTTVLYALVAVVTTNLVSAATIREHAEIALAYAAEPTFGDLGFTLITVAAVLSTASALNATLFSAARLSQQVAEAQTDDDTGHGTSHHRVERESPIRPLLVLGVLTAILTAYGSLQSVTSFASGAFITIFGGVSALAFTLRDGLWSAVVPAVGAVGAAGGVVALGWHLHRTDPSVLVTVAVIWALILSVYWLPRRR